MISTSKFLSPRALARVVGVSESSIKRWADSGRLCSVRTSGGHRRIPIAEAVRFVRESGLSVVEPESLGLPTQDHTFEGRRALDAALFDGRVEDASSRMASRYIAGASPAELCDGPIAAAMGRVGDLWRTAEDGILVEHRATAAARIALARLRHLFPATREGAPVALGGVVPDDAGDLPSAMAATVLAGLGFEVVDLGANTPFDALLQGIEQHAPSLVWVSVTHVNDPESIAVGARKLVRALAPAGTPIVFGGQAARSLPLSPAPHLLQAASMCELEAFGRGVIVGGRVNGEH